MVVFSVICGHGIYHDGPFFLYLGRKYLIYVILDMDLGLGIGSELQIGLDSLKCKIVFNDGIELAS